MYAKVSDEDFIKYVKESFSKAEVIGKCGWIIGSGNLYPHFNHKIQRLGLDISHFDPIGHRGHNKRHDVLKNNGIREKSLSIRRNYLEYCKQNNIDYKCVECGLKEWRDREITLHVDHANGDNTNNDPTNLRWMCPNCHSQTETWGVSKWYKEHKREDKLCGGCGKIIDFYNTTGYCIKCKRNKILDTKISITKQKVKHIIESFCVGCGLLFRHTNHNKSGRCQKCRRKVSDRSSYEQLLLDIKETSMVAVGKKCGVSDNAVRKWIKT